MKFYDMLHHVWAKNNSLVCVGLDPDKKKMPDLSEFPANRRIFEFNKKIVDATHQYVCAYKLQAACYLHDGGDLELCDTIQYIHDICDVPVILDAKRADIGNTSRMYATDAFEHCKADAVTVNPYMGLDGLQPFLDYAEKGVAILCKTSNAGSKDIQNLILSNGIPLYQHVAKIIAESWNYNHNVFLVAGATCPEELGKIRELVGDEISLLVPGIGAQGGDLAMVMKNGMTKDKTGLLINSSRGIIFASSGSDFAEAAKQKTIELRDAINAFRA